MRNTCLVQSIRFSDSIKVNESFLRRRHQMEDGANTTQCGEGPF